jgi:hypothetical protein
MGSDPLLTSLPLLSGKKAEEIKQLTAEASHHFHPGVSSDIKNNQDILSKDINRSQDITRKRCRC